MLITFSGLDGSGKTTQADMLADYLSGRGVACRRRHVIRDSFSYFLNHRVLGRVSPSSSAALEGALRKGGKKGPGSIMASFVKKGLLLLDVLYFRLRYGLFYRGRKKKALILDRYYYDEMVQAIFLGFAGKAFMGIYEKLITRPDIAFFCEVEPDKAYERKKEYTPGYFSSKSGHYGTIAEKGLFTVISSADAVMTGDAVKRHVERLLG